VHCLLCFFSAFSSFSGLFLVVVSFFFTMAAAAVELEVVLLFLASLTPADLPGSTIAIL
jgi:hypothetical protein